MPKARPETRAAQALHGVDARTGALVPPIEPGTTYARDEAYQLVGGLEYTRDDNPTPRHAEALLTDLEGGAAALTFASGMAAATTFFQASLRPGDHVVAGRVMYYGLRRWLADFCARFGVDVDFVDATAPGAISAAMRAGKTRVLWLETPGNPTWDIVDIAGAAQIAHAAGALVAVDSTVATPVCTQPLSLGADLVMHSATKYLSGHGDVLAGALVTAQVDTLWQDVHRLHHDQGAVLAPFEAWLLLRGMRTLYVRVQRQCETAARLADWLAVQPQVAQVCYPGLASHAGHDIARRQMPGGFGGMLSIRVRGGAMAALAVASRLRVFARATSLGGVESLVEHRATVEGKGSLAPEDLLRLSIGLEAPEDLLADLEQALRAP